MFFKIIWIVISFIFIYVYDINMTYLWFKVWYKELCKKKQTKKLLKGFYIDFE